MLLVTNYDGKNYLWHQGKTTPTEVRKWVKAAETLWGPGAVVKIQIAGNFRTKDGETMFCVGEWIDVEKLGNRWFGIQRRKGDSVNRVFVEFLALSSALGDDHDNVAILLAKDTVE